MTNLTDIVLFGQDGWTALHLAAKNGHYAIVEILVNLDSGILDYNIKDKVAFVIDNITSSTTVATPKIVIFRLPCSVGW